MELTKRLKTIASFVEEGSVVADIGTDHAYIPVYLALNNIISKAYAMDISQGALDKAIYNINNNHVNEYVKPILADGLQAVDDLSLDTIIIAGMGGMLIKSILETGKEKLARVKRLILSPHLDADVVRHTVHNLGFSIINEEFIKENEKYYVIIICQQGIEKYNSELEYQYGKCLIETKNSILLEFLINLKNNQVVILKNLFGQPSKLAKKRYDELSEELKGIDEVITCLL